MKLTLNVLEELMVIIYAHAHAHAHAHALLKMIKHVLICNLYL
jgi:hypothetical protein